MFCIKESKDGPRFQSIMDSLEVYERIVQAMFEDGEVNAGRLYVLYVFTKTYCAEYKARSDDIWSSYFRMIEGLGGIPV